MRRRLLFGLLLCFVIAFVNSIKYIGAIELGKDSALSTGRYRLVWNDDPTTTITIAWDQIRGSDPVIYYGPKDFRRKWEKYPFSQNPTRTMVGYRGMNTHFAKITGLKPDKVYYFVINDSEDVSKRFWFRTAPGKPKPFTFIAGGDTKSSGTALEAGRLSNKMVAKLRPLFVVFNGDFTSGDGTNDERWKLWLDDWATLTTTKDGRMIPIIPVHGNHENGDKSVLNKLFNVPYQNGNEENIFYSISFGGDFFHFIALNSEIEEGGDQRAWLENDLKTHQHFKFKTAGYHKPFRPHTSKKAENYYQYEQWAPLFHAYGLDMALGADTHMSSITYPIRPSIELQSYEGFIRDDENGTMYIGEGSWGASYRSNDDDKPWTLRSGSFNQFKWFHVFPEKDGKLAHIDIRTVITATKDEGGKIISHIDKVEELSEENIFAIPKNINMFAPEPYGAAITYPFTDKYGTAKTKSLEESMKEPVKYIGKVQPDKRYYDGRLRHAVGVHHYQVFRANHTHPSEGGEVGWTYNHQPYLAYWNGQFYLQFLSGLVEEHTPPTRTMLVISKDGRIWSDPIVVFPEYELPEIKKDDIYIPAGIKSVMHQRMGFYVAPNGRLLTLAFYSYCATPRHSPNKGHGLGRVVREIYKDGSFGRIYFVRYNRHVGWNEGNTDFPFYKESNDSGFIRACEDLLEDKLMTLQWWEEDRGEDGFFAIDPSQIKDEDPIALQSGVTTSAGAGKAFCFFHRPDDKVVGLWKNQYSALSMDDGKTWTPIVKSTTLLTCGAKVWSQRTDDGRYVLVHDQSPTRRNRFPMVVITSEDGQAFNNMLCLQGEVPPQRYQGIHKNRGPQYVRGIVEGNGNPPGNYLWNVYSMNKEDIWVSRTRVPITGIVKKHADENFEKAETEADLELWNLYMPKWAPIQIVSESGNKCLEIRDEDPYDHALAERAFPESRKVTVEFRFKIARVVQGYALEFEVQDQHGARPMRLRFDKNWMGLDRGKVFPLTPVPINSGKWYHITLKLDCDSQTYDLSVDGEWIRKKIAFAEKVDSLERMLFRTGPYRGDVRMFFMENGEPRPAGLYSENLPGAEEKVAMSCFLIDQVKTREQ